MKLFPHLPNKSDYRLPLFMRTSKHFALAQLFLLTCLQMQDKVPLCGTGTFFMGLASMLQCSCTPIPRYHMVANHTIVNADSALIISTAT